MQRLKCNYCGNTITISELSAFLHYVTGRKYYVQCNECGHVSNYIIRLWLVHNTLDDVENGLNRIKRW